MTIHPEHPFLPPAGEGDPARRLRSRLVAPVTIWAASSQAPDGRISRAGFTVGSTTVTDGAPACVLGVIDPEADLWPVMSESGRFTVNLLQWSDRYLADVFAGLAPAPGGSFGSQDWQDTPHGPALGARTWAACQVVESRTLGYGLLVIGSIDSVLVDPSGDDADADAASGGDHSDALARLRGRYTPVPAPRR